MDEGLRRREQARRAVLFGFVGILLAACLALLSAVYQHRNRLLCQGLLGAGFPAPVVCDASGESPLSSVGRIDRADLDNINMVGSTVDVLFYLAAVWGVGALADVIVRSFRRFSGKKGQGIRG